MKYLLIAITILISGCSLLQNSSQVHQKHTQVKKTQIRASSMIRGVIKSQIYEQKTKLWRYNLKVIDIQNDQNTNISFLFTQKKYNIGDLVYVVFKNSKIAKEIYLGRKIAQKPFKILPKLHKRTKARQKIHVPKTETIKLN